MLAPEGMIALGEAVRRDTINFSGAKDKGKDEAERARLREMARAAVDAFTAGARDDRNLSSRPLGSLTNSSREPTEV